MINISAPTATPYDIVPIPTFPFIPPLWFWLTVVGIGAVVFIINKFFTNRAHRITIKKFDLLKNEVERSINRDIDSVTASRISLMLKRFLSSESQKLGSSLSMLPALSPQEIRAVTEETSDSAVKAALQIITEIDLMRFQNCQAQPELSGNLSKILGDLKIKFESLKHLRGNS